MKQEVAAMKQTALVLPNAHNEVLPSLEAIQKELDDIYFAFRGLKAKASWEEIPPANMPLMNRLNSIIWAQINSTSDITTTSKTSFEILKEKFPPVLEQVKIVAETKLPEARKQMDALNAPYTKGRIPQWK
jgi:kynureninase